MEKSSFLKYCLQAFSFARPKKLNYLGNHMCYLKSKEILQNNKSNSRSAKYSLCLESKNPPHTGIVFVDESTYNEAIVGEEFGNLSLVSNKKGEIRFTKKVDSTEALNEVSKIAKRIALQTLLVFLFFLIPPVALLFLVINFIV